MARNQPCCRRQRQYTPPYALHHLVKIAARVVGTPHGAAEYGVAAKHHSLSNLIEAYTALGMAGGLYHLETQPLREGIVAGHYIQNRPLVWLVRQPHHMAEARRPLEHRLVFRVHIHRYGPALYSIFQPEDMVKMTVCEQHRTHLQLLFPYIAGQPLPLPFRYCTGIDNHTLAGIIADDIGTLSQRVEIKNFVHTAKLQSLLLNLYDDRKSVFIMHIAIAGNIGSGKTTLTRLLCEHYKWIPRFEPVDHNPYLADFYEDMERWSFNLQIYFLNKRFRDVVEISRSSDVIVQDRTIYEDANIFAPNLHDMGLMATRDFENYKDLFNLMISLVKAPDLLIYLRSSIPNVVAKIQKRGREYENSIRIDYLKGLHDRYEKWIENYTDGKLLILDVDKYDFEENPADLRTVCDLIDAQLNGLF